MAKVESGARQWQETQEHASPCLSGGGDDRAAVGACQEGAVIRGKHSQSS